jgi:hypothetical protein
MSREQADIVKYTTRYYIRREPEVESEVEKSPCVLHAYSESREATKKYEQCL